jgi:hypothetical protein
MSLSASLDGLLRLFFDRKLRQKEAVIQFLECLVEHTQQLASIWGKAYQKADRLVPNTLDQYFVGIDRSLAVPQPHQMESYSYVHSLYGVLSAAIGDKVDQRTLDRLYELVGNILRIRCELYQVQLDPIAMGHDVERVRNLVISLNDVVAQLYSEVQVIKAVWS